MSFNCFFFFLFVHLFYKKIAEGGILVNEYLLALEIVPGVVKYRHPRRPRTNMLKRDEFKLNRLEGR